MDMFKRVFLSAVGLPKRMNEVEQLGVAEGSSLLSRVVIAKRGLVFAGAPALEGLNAEDGLLGSTPALTDPLAVLPQPLPTLISLTGLTSASAPTVLLTPSSTISPPSLVSLSTLGSSTEDSSSSVLTATPTSDPVISGSASALPSNTSTPSLSDSSEEGPIAASLPASSIPIASNTASPDAEAAAPSNWFMENKTLSITLLTLFSLVALVLIVTFGTWCIRRRRRDRLQDLTADFSAEELAGPGDVEKGDALSALGSALPMRPAPTSTSASPVSGPRRGLRSATLDNRDMYERTGYPSLPVFVPRGQIEDNDSIRDFDPTMSPVTRRGSNTPQFPGAFDTSRLPPGLTPPPPARGVGRPFNTTRKPPPPLLQVDIPIYSGVGTAALRSSISLALSPMQIASPVNPGRPLDSPQPSPLFNPLQTPTTPRGSPHARSHSRMLDPKLPGMPIPAPLPDVFGSSPSPSREAVPLTPTRQLKVVNQ